MSLLFKKDGCFKCILVRKGLRLLLMKGGDLVFSIISLLCGNVFEFMVMLLLGEIIYRKVFICILLGRWSRYG